MAGADSDACKVTVQGGEGTTLQIGAGAVYIRGRAAVFDGTETVTVSEDCKIVVRMNKSLEVRNFQLLALTGELVSTEDICDLELARAHLEPVSGGHRVTLTDTRTFLAYMGQPAYYPPDDENLPYVLWLYTLGFPMDEEQREAVEGNPSLMEIFRNSLGAVRSTTEDLQEGLAAHAGNRENPHGVTAQQVGADPAGTGAAVQQALNSHTANRSNPHGVTIDQIGADRGWTLIGSISVSVKGDYAINSAAEYDSIKMVFEIQSFQALQTSPFELQGTSSASLVIIKNGSYDAGITPVNKKCVFQSTQSSVFTSTKGEGRYFERYYFIPGSDSIPYSNSSANISAVVFDGQNYKFSFGAQGSSDTVNMTVKLYGKNEG